MGTGAQFDFYCANRGNRAICDRIQDQPCCLQMNWIHAAMGFLEMLLNDGRKF
jgi:hypothetical protein